MFWDFKAGLIAAAILVASPARADCRIEAADLDLAAKTRFQEGFFAAVVAARPELTEVARANRDLQLAMATSRRTILAYLATSAPERLVTDRGVSAFSNADWSRGDDNVLRAADSDYDQLSDRINFLSVANQRHPDWPALRQWAREDRDGRAAITRLTSEFRESQAKVADALSRC